MFVVGVDWVRMNAKGASFAHLHISPRSAIRSESPGNSFSPTYVRGGLPYLAGWLPARSRHRQTDRQTRGLSQSITKDLTAPLKKNLP